MLTVRTPGTAAVQVMQIIRKTVANFFACRECQMHFAKVRYIDPICLTNLVASCVCFLEFIASL